jgi:ribosome-binding factor A
MLFKKITFVGTPFDLPMDSIRQNKIARLLQKELAVIFQAESRNHFPGKLITVTVVRVSPDLGLAKVYLSIYPRKKDEDIIAEVTQHSSMIRNALGRVIRHQVRVIPELAFYIDDSMDYVERIDRLLKS